MIFPPSVMNFLASKFDRRKNRALTLPSPAGAGEGGPKGRVRDHRKIERSPTVREKYITRYNTRARRKALTPAFLFLWTTTAAETPADGYARALAAYGDRRYGAALQEFLLFVGENPADQRIERALFLIKDVAQKARESRGVLDPTEGAWKKTVKNAEAVSARRRRAAEDTAARLEELAAALKDSRAPLPHLRQSRVDPVAIDRSFLDPRVEARIDKNLAAVTAALENRPEDGILDYADTHELNGYVFLYGGHPAAALEEWKTALAWKTDDRALAVRVESLEARLSLAARRRQAEAIAVNAMGHFKAERYDEAVAEFKKAAALDPVSRDLRFQLMRAEEARDTSSRRKKIDALLRQGRASLNAGRSLDALQSLADALTLDPGHAEARRLLLEARGKLAPSASSTPVDSPPAGKLRKSAGPDASASPSLPKGDPQKAEEAYAVGLIHYMEGNLKEAEASFLEALRRQPGYATAQQALEQLRKERKLR